MKQYILSVLLALFLATNAVAQDAVTDRKWYLAGEQMTVCVSMPDACIAYAELCDTHSLAAGTLISIDNGKGIGHIELPQTMHSGYYQLSVYSRGSSSVWQCLVPVINPLYGSTDDDMTWEELPLDGSGTTDSHALHVPEAVPALRNIAVKAGMGIKEVEGHIVMAHIRKGDKDEDVSSDLIHPSLSVVGKQIHYFEGRMVNDTTALFFTNDIYGRLPIMLAANMSYGGNMPIELVSPFETLVPSSLPHLTFCYQRKEVEERSRQMQLHQIAITPAKKELSIGEQETDDATIDTEPLPYDNRIYSMEPSISYNLDEYRQFATIKETLLEYVRNVHRISNKGVEKLAVYNEQDGYASWPAMVFIDGMPVYDIPRLLSYDARRVHYINVYEDRYTFGNAMYKGILSIVTRSGKLTNYPIEPYMSYLVYDFPTHSK